MFLPSKRSSVLSLLVLVVFINHAVANHGIVGVPPSITTEPRDTVVFRIDAQGNKANLVLNCEVEGNPQPNVTWFMGDDIMVDQQYVMDDGRLVIPNITEGEMANREGVLYYCMASNVIGLPEMNYTATVRSRKARVTYAFFDGFTTNASVTRDVRVQVGSNVALECDVGEASPPPVIEWYTDVDDNANPNTGGRVEATADIFFLENGRYLALYDLTAEQIGMQYRCHVMNALRFSRQLSRVTYSLTTDGFPVDELVEYKLIGDVTAFVTDNEVEFSYVGGSFGSGNPGIFTQCELLNGTVDLDITVSAPDGRGTILMSQIPSSTPTSNMFTIRCQIGFSGGSTIRNGNLRVYQRAIITEYPDGDREFVVGQAENIPFECVAAGIPVPTIEWFINGEEVRSDNGDGISIEGNVLTIVQPSPSHSGMYQCSASNNFATDLRSWVLEVREPTMINITEFNLTALGAVEDRDFGAVIVKDEGTQNVDFFIVVDADPCPSVQWSLNGTNITNGSSYTISDPCGSEGATSPYTYTVTIGNLTEETSGSYSAVFTSLDSVMVSPKAFVTIPRPVSIANVTLTLEGQTTRVPCLLNNSVAFVRCNVAGFPRPEVTFFRGTFRIDPGEPSFERYSTPFFDELQINGVIEGDDNDDGFSCRTNPQGTDIMPEGDFPFCTFPDVVNSSRTEKPLLGEDFFVECSISGRPAVMVKWLKDDQVLQRVEGKIEIVVPVTPAGSPVVSRVEVSNAAAENDGRYTCRGTNEAGTDEMNFQIQSQDPSGGLALPVPAIIGIAAGGAGAIILIVLIILLIVCVYQCALRSKKGSMDMPPPYSGKMYTDYSDGRGNVDDSDEEEGQPEAFNPQYESLPALRPSQPPGYKPTPSYPHGVGDDMEMVKIPPPDTDSFVGGAPPYMHQDNGLPSSSYRPTVDDFVSEDAQFV